MAYPPHYLLQFGGPLVPGEIWSQTLRFAGDIGPGDDEQGSTQGTAFQGTKAQEESLLEGYLADIEAFLARPASFIANSTQLSYAKLNRIGPDGRYVNNYTAEVQQAPVGTTAGGARLPPQCAVVVTLRTAIGRGIASRGRVYVPALSIGTNQATGRLTPADQQGMADSYGQLVRDLNNQPGVDGPDLRVSVVSDGGRSGIGRNAPVREVLVGDVIDTQRSRRNQLSESYLSASTDGA